MLPIFYYSFYFIIVFYLFYLFILHYKLQNYTFYIAFLHNFIYSRKKLQGPISIIKNVSIIVWGHE